MKVLQINNFHYYRGGVERCYLDTGRILEEKGHEVAYFAAAHPKNLPSKWRDYFVSYYELNDKQSFVNKLKVAARFFYNREAKKKIRRLIRDFQPDVAHAHNIYHHLSPSILKELKKHGIPVVMTLHDYKLICPNYNLFVRGRIWEKSKPHKYYRCLLDKCVGDSYFKSLLCTLEAYFHYWFRFYGQVDVFLSPSRFLADKFREFDFKRDIKVLPNPLLLNTPDPQKKERDYFLYFGRLAPEKGIKEAIRAWSELTDPPRLLVLGEGPQRQELEELVEQKNLEGKIVFLGHKKKEELFAYISSSRGVIFPSRWQENYPYSLLEAGYLKKILVCANIGGISEIVEEGVTGFLYPPNKPEELREIIRKVWKDQGKWQDRLGKNIFDQVSNTNHPESYYQRLITIYKNLI